MRLGLHSDSTQYLRVVQLTESLERAASTEDSSSDGRRKCQPSIACLISWDVLRSTCLPCVVMGFMSL